MGTDEKNSVNKLAYKNLFIWAATPFIVALGLVIESCFGIPSMSSPLTFGEAFSYVLFPFFNFPDAFVFILIPIVLGIICLLSIINGQRKWPFIVSGIFLLYCFFVSHLGFVMC